MKRLLLFPLLAGVIMLAGCDNISAALSGAVSKAQESAAAGVRNVQQLNDFNAGVWAATGCAAPFGEMVRNGSGNPGYVSAVIDLCGVPAGLMRVPVVR